MLPHLFEEIETNEQEVDVNSVTSDLQAEKKTSSKKFCGYNPDVVDFIRRCDNIEQAQEIIQYLEKRGEISSEYASRLGKQLKEKGVRSFGHKKEDDCYYRNGEI